MRQSEKYHEQTGVALLHYFQKSVLQSTYKNRTAYLYHLQKWL